MAKKTRHQWQADDPEGDAAPVQSRTSRSEKRRQADRLTQLGVRLTELDATAVARLEMDDELRAAVDTCRSLKRGNGRARQQRLIGKLLRKLDVDPLLSQLERLIHGVHEKERIRRVRADQQTPATGQPGSDEVAGSSGKEDDPGT